MASHEDDGVRKEKERLTAKIIGFLSRAVNLHPREHDQSYLYLFLHVPEINGRTILETTDGKVNSSVRQQPSDQDDEEKVVRLLEDDLSAAHNDSFSRQEDEEGALLVMSLP